MLIIATVHSVLVQNVNKAFVYITDFTPRSMCELVRYILDTRPCGLPEIGRLYAVVFSVHFLTRRAMTFLV